MNIFLTGGSGFVGRSLISTLATKHNIYAPSSTELDLTDLAQVKVFLGNKDVQFIINCAVRGGRRTKIDTEQDFYNNIKILDNLLYFVNDNRKLITFSSGAELYNPNGFYGFSKKVSTSLIKNKNNIKNLRIYNVFGELGMEDSFVYVAIKKCLNNEDIVIWEDRAFDIYYIRDLINMIDIIMENNSPRYEEIDCVYKQKYKLSEIAALIKLLCGSANKIIIEKRNGIGYIGTHKKIENLIHTPIEESLINMIEYIRKKQSEQ